MLFVKKTILNNWSRAVLLNFLYTDLYERQGKAISNFEYALPEPQSDLAQEITKGPYNFDFVAIREDYSEKELKRRIDGQHHKISYGTWKRVCFCWKRIYNTD